MEIQNSPEFTRDDLAILTDFETCLVGYRNDCIVYYEQIKIHATMVPQLFGLELDLLCAGFD